MMAASSDAINGFVHIFTCDQDGGWRVKRVESLTVQNLTQSMSLTVESLKELWAKEFLRNIRKEIARKSTRLKPVFSTSKKGSTKLKSPKILFQRNTTLWYRRSRT